LKPL